MDGLIYYNVGLKCLVRLAVSLLTLTRHYKNSITIITDDVGAYYCEKMGAYFGTKVLRADFSEIPGDNIPFLNKCRLHLKAPYERTIFLDADTIVFQDFSECFNLIDEHEFIVPQFSNWLSSGRRLTKRINRWKGHVDESFVRHAFDEPKAINTGMFGWKKGAKIFDGWFDLALKNRDSFIPDEIACQIILPHVPHLVIGSEYNTSCKHELFTDRSKILHYHGRKHCRLSGGNYEYHSELWYREFNKIRELQFVKCNIQHDRMLAKFLPEHDRCNLA